MTAQPTSRPEGRIRQMGKVYAEVTVINDADLAAAGRGLIAEDGIRSLTLPAILVDTGATTLCLPRYMIEQLGLPFLKPAVAITAGGDLDVEIFIARISIMGRVTVAECMQLPDDRQPLLGVIPLEALGLEPDLANQRLRALPTSGPDNYLTIL